MTGISRTEMIMDIKDLMKNFVNFKEKIDYIFSDKIIIIY